ncbi:MAG: YHYH protein [Microthrixaceae bacterium]
MNPSRGTTRWAHLAAAILALSLAPACGSGEEPTAASAAPDESTTTELPTSTTAATEATGTSVPDGEDDHGHGLSGEVDITDTILTNTSADCGDYDVTLTASVNDITRQIMFDSGVTLTAGADSCSLASNNIPNHDFNDETADFATDVAEVPRAFTIIRNPERAAAPTPLEQQTYDGVLLNGVVIDLLSAGCYRPDGQGADADGNVAIGCSADDPWLTNPLGTDHLFGADAHNAHTQPDGTYHYHGNPLALFDDNPGPDGSPLIGFAADGFPIFGSYFVDPETGEVRKAVSGYELRDGDRPAGDANPPGAYDGTYYDDYEFTGSGDLDECNGMEVDGQYGYYVTDEYPYLMFCLSGTPDPSFGKGQGAAGGAPAGNGPPLPPSQPPREQPR